MAIVPRLIPKIERLLKPESHVPAPVIAQTSVSFRKIPEVTVLPFAGDITAYASFHLKYNELQISDAKRLQNLKSCVKEEAFKIIGNLDLNDENYCTALKALAKQYNSKAMVTTGKKNRHN
jgi:hypothetical protein